MPGIVYRAWEEWSFPLYRWTPRENGKQIMLGERSILPRYLWLSPVVAAEAERTGIVWVYRPELLNAVRRPYQRRPGRHCGKAIPA
jgi:hypothetical protein